MKAIDWRFVGLAALLGLALVLSDVVAGLVRGYGANPWGLL